MTENVHQAELSRLVAGALNRDPGSWDEIVLRYRRLVYAVVAAHRMQAADNEDAVQNTWLRAVEGLHSLRNPDCLAPWLITIARRECLALLTRARRERPHSSAADNLVEREPGPEAMVLLTEACGAVRVAMDGLPAKRRRLVEILYFEEANDYLSASSVAGMPIGSIGPTKMRTMSSLRRALEHAGFDSADAVPA
jgi:RNA polymerase sigma factor (sigma-70 family)